MLFRLSSKAIQHVPDVYIAGDKARTLLGHRPQHSLPAFVNERNFIEVHDAPSSLRWGVRLLPAGLQFIDPWRDEAALQRPTLFHRRVGNRDPQHVPSPLSGGQCKRRATKFKPLRLIESLNTESTNGSTDKENRISGFKCRRCPTLVEKGFESPTLSHRYG